MNGRLDQAAYCRTRHHENSSAPFLTFSSPPPFPIALLLLSIRSFFLLRALPKVQVGDTWRYFRRSPLRRRRRSLANEGSHAFLINAAVLCYTIATSCLSARTPRL